MTELSAYVLEPIREGPDFTVYRGRQHGNPWRVLAVALAAEHPSPQGLRRLEHEYSLAAELDSAWAAKPLALTRHEGRTILILMDPGGEPLDLVLQRGQTLDLTGVLRIAIGLATALGQVHRRGLIPDPHYNRTASRLALVIVEERADVEHLDPRVQHLVPRLHARALRSADARPDSQHRSDRWRRERPQRSAGTTCRSGH